MNLVGFLVEHTTLTNLAFFSSLDLFSFAR